jgi:hypothetical protein
MPQRMVRVRMLRHVAQYVQVLDLEMGETYDINESHAEQFITNGTAELPAIPEKKSRLEAAALESAQRRG